MKIKLNKVIILICFIFLCQFFNVVDVSALVDEYSVYINGVEVNEFDLIDSNSINVNQSYIGSNLDYNFSLDDSFVIDYTNKLYGNYNYTFSLLDGINVIDSRNIVINYIGENNDIINTNNIYYKDKNYYILDNELTVLDLLNLYNNSLDEYNAELVVLDNDDIELSCDDIVESGYKLKLIATYDDYGVENIITDYFYINLVSDMNYDGIIDNNDLKIVMVDDLLSNSDSIFSIDDIYDIDNIEFIESSDELNKVISYREDIFFNDELEIKYYLDGFDNDSISSIVGKLNFDDNMFELISIDLDSLYGNYTDDGNFIYLLDNYNRDGLFITFKFKVLKTGVSNISLDSLDVMTECGDRLLVNDKLFDKTINVLEYGKGGDIEEITKEEVKIEHNPVKVTKINNITPIVYEELSPSKVIEYISLSDDNYIKKLIIKDYKIKFDKDILEYNIKLKSNINKLDIDIILSDNDSDYEIIGNENFKVGIIKHLVPS